MSTAALDKLQFLETLKQAPLDSLGLRVAARNEELPIWLVNSFLLEFRKDFPRLLAQAEKNLKAAAENELELAITKMVAELDKLKQALKELNKLVRSKRRTVDLPVLFSDP